MISSYHIFFRRGDRNVKRWADLIKKTISREFPSVSGSSVKPELVIVLGGDGTIIEAAKKFFLKGSSILGLNLGNVGFLASVRDEKYFLKAVRHAIRGRGKVAERTALSAAVLRHGQTVFKTTALNEVTVQNLLGMVRLTALVAGHPVQRVQGSGILVSTPTGSTAFNLSAHGPLVAPDMDCLILTEILDHTIPTPSIVINSTNTVRIRVDGFRRQDLVFVKSGRKPADVILVADGASFFPLVSGDEIEIKKHPLTAHFVEIENNYYFKSLEEKFGFR